MAGQKWELFLVLVAALFSIVLSAKPSKDPRATCPFSCGQGWNYNNPGSWGTLCPHYSQCSQGQQQSPIDLSASSLSSRSLNLTLDYVWGDFIRVGDLLTLSVSTQNYLNWNGRRYLLSRVEFHAPSEHTVNGAYSDVEAQFFFTYLGTTSSKSLAVAVFFNRSTNCPAGFLSKIAPAIPCFSRCTCGDNRLQNYSPYFEECDNGAQNGFLPNSCRPNCRLPRCGDGVQDSGEECDEGTNSTSCRPNCKRPSCGDRIVDRFAPYSEQCDDGNNLSGDGCSPNCTLECGNGCLDGNEECDFGAGNSNATYANALLRNICRPNCRFPYCGDGVVDPALKEVCDNGTRNSDTAPNACRTNCAVPYCGDNVVDTNSGEQCDPPNTASCDATCKLYCGNGKIDGNEECDNGPQNFNSSNRCRANCRLPRCGDGIVDSGEQCDTVVATAACNANCTFRCGNGILESGEECDNGDPSLRPDDGNSDTRANACRLTCRIARCGDGVVDACEKCDQGSRNSNTTANACRSNCVPATCGDGVVDNGEQCDDGNSRANDGCTCCVSDCGNGILQDGEECDEGAANNNIYPDRCRSSCRISYCGDGVTDSNEECDPKAPGSLGCSANCTRPFCGDGIVQTFLGEECDLGDANSYSAFNGCSPLCTQNQCGQVSSSIRADLKTIFPSAQLSRYFFYNGSTTHPPCTEGVEWLVDATVRDITEREFIDFTRCLQGNNRPVQPRALPAKPNTCGNGILESGEQCDKGSLNNDFLPDHCRTTCRIPSCGDGVVDSDEECDGDATCSTVTCRFIRDSYATPYLDGACSGPQSPIKLPQVCTRNRLLNLNHPSNVNYNPIPLTLFNLGDNIILPATTGGAFSWKGITYVLDHIEFYQPSEHYIGDKQYPFEVQLVHKAQNPGVQESAVLSVLFEVGSDPNAFLKPILDKLPPVSTCSCGNGIKEPFQWSHSGKITAEECDNGKNNNDHSPNCCRTSCKLPSCGDAVVDSCEFCDQGPLNSFLPNMCRPTCVAPFCGDGIVDSYYNEECDDGNNRDGDGCNRLCFRECGNGILDSNEQCDDGLSNSDNQPDACRSNCRVAHCGDGVVDYGEECDAANSDNKPNSCRRNCRVPYCGDGVTDNLFGEQCDGGAGCTSNCTKVCGNGVLDQGEECDNGTLNSDVLPNACRTNCKISRCGDGVRDKGEECDNGPQQTLQCSRCRILCGNGKLDLGEYCDNGVFNSDSVQDACRTNCSLPYCGDGVVDNGEECDDRFGQNGNTPNSCRAGCTKPFCGDGIVDPFYGEQCDDGNKFDGDGCSALCSRECGNGVLDAGEECDLGSVNSDASDCCRSNCRLPKCGDGIVDKGEECDEGARNANSPNSCRPDCTLPKCGDGIVDNVYGEKCDHGACNSLLEVDGCSPDCTPNICRQSVWYNVTVNPKDLLPVQSGVFHYTANSNSRTTPCALTQWFVFTAPATLTECQLNQFKDVISDNNRCLKPREGRKVELLELSAICGDGIVEGNEECDNGPLNSDYAADSCRRDCRSPRCGDGVRDSTEQCDGTPNCSETCSLDCTPKNATTYPADSAQPAPVPSMTNDGTIINVNFANILAQ